MMMQNKILRGLAAVAILSLFFGCASTDESVKEVVFDNGDQAVAPAEETEEQLVSDSNAVVVTTEEKTASQIETDVALTGKESKKNYTGWVASSVRPITNTIGNIKLDVRPKKGTFSICVVNPNEKAIPVISTANEYTTTSLYLKAGKKILKLCDDSNVSSAAKKTANGVSIRYTIDKTAIVQLDFECIASVEGQNEDTIKITASVQSLTKKKTEFALKMVLDTVLGETDRHHFYTFDDVPVKGEVLYHSMDEEKVIVSKNAKATMQIILAGADVSPVESVALANYTTIDTRKWEADMTTFRSFDTVLSYNNSAVAIYWPKESLEPDAEMTKIFYVSMATGENIPGGAAFVTGQISEEEPAEEEPAQEQEPASEKQDNAGAVESIQAVKEEPEVVEPVAAEPVKTEPVKTEPVKTEPKVIEPQPVLTETKPQAVSTVEKKTPSISEDKLSIDYIQMLLDRIESLEEGDPTVNKEEINALNAELDAILTILNAK